MGISNIAVSVAPPKFGWPICARCKKPVDGISSTYDPFIARHVVVATCHGASEETFIKDEELQDAEAIGLRFGFAFVELDTSRRLPDAR